MEADLSEHFGRFGEFLVGLTGLFLLLLIIPDTRRLLRRTLSSFAVFAVRCHRALETRSDFYRRWSDALRMMFRERRDLLLIVAALTAFDYLSGWHANFMLGRFNLYPQYESYDPASVFIAYFFSAPYALTLLRIAGYALFCWLAYRTASGASYREASSFRPFPQLAGLFLCIYGAQGFADTLTPYLLLTIGQAGDDMLFFIGVMAVSIIVCAAGVKLLTPSRDGARAATPLSALFGYLLATHLLQWLYFYLDWAARPGSVPWLRVAEYYASNFTLTLLWNVALVAFAVRLSGPPRQSETASHHAADAV